MSEGSIANLRHKAGPARLLMAFLVPICLLPLILPGDAPWVNDEPQLLAMAQKFNHSPGHFLGISLPFSIADHGLTGTRGTIYGPGAEWFYQILLAILPHDLVLLTVVRAAIVTAITAISLVWISRLSGLRFDFVLALMLSPWVWLYSRQLWDNSLLIPLSALLLAGYLAFLARRSSFTLALTISCALLMLLIHFMAIAIVLPVALHVVWLRPKTVLDFKWTILATLSLVGLFVWPYVPVFIATYRSGYFADSSSWGGWVFPLLGAHHLSAIGMGFIFGDDWLLSACKPWSFLIAACNWIGGIAYIASWVGMILAIPMAWRIWFKRQKGSIRDHLAAIALATWFCQTLLDGTERVYEYPHYHNSTWIVYAVFAWLAFDALPKKGFAKVFVPVYAVSLLIMILFAMIQVHRNNGCKSLAYGPTIANQQAVADEMGKYAQESFRDPQFENWREFPVAYTAIHALRLRANGPIYPARHLVIRYRNDFPGDAQIVVDVLPVPATRLSNDSTVSK